MSEALKTHVESYQPEVAARDDIHTWLAEVLDGNMRSEFSYTFNGNDLIARDGRPLGPVFEDSVDDAKQKAADDVRFNFELRRRKVELDEYYDLIEMAKGQGSNTMIVVSDFPEELTHSSTDFGGYNVSRKQTMLRIISRQPGGTIRTVSQSLDRSDRQALEEIYDHFGLVPERGELLGQRIYQELDLEAQDELPDLLMRRYDVRLQEKYGGDWYGGRSSLDRRNTMDFALRQSDLINAYLDGVKSEQATYNLAAAITARFERPTTNEVGRNRQIEASSRFASLAPILEMEIQGRISAQEGRTYSGCGGSIHAPGGRESELAILGYGDQDKKISDVETDKFGSLTFKCQNGHDNKRPRGKLIDCCKTCGVNVKCDD